MLVNEKLRTSSIDKHLLYKMCSIISLGKNVPILYTEKNLNQTPPTTCNLQRCIEGYTNYQHKISNKSRAHLLPTVQVDMGKFSSGKVRR